MSSGQGASASRTAGALAGSGALSHAYIQYPPFRCNIPGAIGVMYDDGNRLLLVPSPNKVFSWSVMKHPPSDSPSIISVNEGSILALRYSLDGTILALLRSNTEVEFTNRENGAVFRQQCKSQSERILGFFWTDSPTCDIVFVTSSGLELYSLNLGMNGVKLVETKRSNISWYVYTHESRLVLLASGMQCKTLSGYQFSAGGIIRLPKFEVSMTKEEANKKPVLAPEDVRITTMYGRLYCLQVDQVAMQINLYRFYRDAVVPQGSLPIFSPNVAISVVDNVLLVHQVDSKVVLLYDIFSDQKYPISAPLPLLLRGLSLPPGVADRSIEGTVSEPSSSKHCEDLTPFSTNLYGEGWVFVNPDIILDHAHGLLWRIHLDLDAIAASSSDIPSLLGFLQRRRQEAGKAKQLSLAVLRSIIIERRPLSLIADAMDVITCACSHANKPNSASVHKQIAGKTPSSINMDAQNRSRDTCQHTSSIEAAGAQHPVPSNIVKLGSMNELDEKEVNDEEKGNQELSSLEVSSNTDTETQDFQDNMSNAEVNIEVGDATGSPLSDSLMQIVPAEEDGGGATNVRARGKAEACSEASCSAFEQGQLSPRSENGARSVHFSDVQHGRSWDPADSQNFRSATATISTDEMHQHVFAVLEEEMVADSTFLVASVIEYMRSAAAEKLKVHPGLHALVVQLLAKDERYIELWQFISNKVLEPSKDVALQLLQVGNRHLPTYRLGMEMLKQLSLHTEYISLLLQAGRLLEALRYARQSRVEAIPPSTFLEAAAAVQDSQKLACVLRFCLDFVPNFEQTPEYISCFALLKQQNMAFAQ